MTGGLRIRVDQSSMPDTGQVKRESSNRAVAIDRNLTHDLWRHIWTIDVDLALIRVDQPAKFHAAEWLRSA